MKIFQSLYITASVLVLAQPLFAQEKPRENKTAVQPAATAPEKKETDPNPAQLNVDPAVGKILADFFLALENKQIDQAYDQLTKGSKIAEKPEDVANLKSQTTKALRVFGEIQGYELVQVHSVGTRLLRITCLSISRDLPLRWRFYFYRADSDWKLVDIGVNDRLVDLYEETEPAAPRNGTPRQ